jgi:hypothetical protein
VREPPSRPVTLDLAAPPGWRPSAAAVAAMARLLRAVAARRDSAAVAGGGSGAAAVRAGDREASERAM